MRSIYGAELKVAVDKTEALVQQPPPDMSMRVGTSTVKLQSHIKYLGL